MSYDPNVDYKKLMEEAVARGDLTQAALYEQKRNEKIQGLGLTQYARTKDYEKYLPQSTQKQMEEVWSKIENREPFSYDFRKDKLYDRYRDHYNSTGKAAMEEANASSALLTGGFGNSYGAVLGKAAYSQEMDKLHDKVEDLTQEAKADYDARGEALYEQYDRLSKELSARREAAEKLSQQEAKAKEQAYEREQKAKDEAKKAEKEAKEQAYSLALSMLKSGIYPSDALLSNSGISPQDAKALYEAYASEKNGASSSAGSSKGNSAGSSKGSDSSKDKDSQSASPGKALSNSLWSQLQKAYEEGSKAGDLTAFHRSRSSLEAQGYAVEAFDAWARSTYGDGYDSGGKKVVDRESVLALGYGPLSAERLKELVQAGVIEEYTYGDYIRYRKRGKNYLSNPTARSFE